MTKVATSKRNQMSPQAKRNLNPHKAAIAAMYLWGDEYSLQGGGSMDFWDALGGGRKETCRELVAKILEAPSERGR